MYSVVKLEPGLQLERVNGRPTYRARAHLQGAVGYLNTRTESLAEATEKAIVWFVGWKRSLAPRTMAAAAKLHADTYSPRQLSTKADFWKRWHAISSINGIGRMDVTQVDLRFLKAFMKQRSGLTGNTQKKDLDTIRPILRAAHEEGWISAMPLMPKAKVVKNPRVPFNAAEWRAIQEALRITPDLYDFAHVIVLGLLRPHEVLRLTVRDMKVDGNRIVVHVRRKTGIAHAPVPMRFPRLRAILLKRALMHDDRLFPYSANWFPHAFGKLLDQLGLRQAGAHVKPRDSWSLRATGICMEIKRQRRVKGSADLLKIARWAGTSVSRIDGHYAAFLG